MNNYFSQLRVRETYMKRILVLEDEEDIRDFIVINLKRSGLDVIEASTGEEAIKLIDHEDIDVAVLDVMLPGIDGFDVLKNIRQKNKTMGVIMLTALGQEIDKISGLSMGADDYIVKPFSPRELVARIEAILRRIDLLKKENDKDELVLGPFKLDKKGMRLTKEDVEIELTLTEYSIIKLFMESPDKAFSRDEILDAVWGKNYFGNWKTVDVNIRRIRQKIEEDPSNPKYIHTLWGHGYRWGEGD